MHNLGRLAIVLFLLASALTPAQQIKPGQEGSLDIPDCSHKGMLYVPSDYRPGRRLPLIFFMHGSGGKPTTWPWKSATGGKGYFIAGLPYGAQDDAGAGGIKSDKSMCLAMAAFIDKTRKSLDDTYGIDDKGVILSGLSMGGWGVSFYGFLDVARGRYCAYAILAAGPRQHGAVDFSVTEGLPVLLLNGETDANLAAANRGKPWVEAAGARVTQEIIPGQGHVPSVQSMVEPLRKWLTFVETERQRKAGIAAVNWTSVRLEGEPPANRDKVALETYLAGQPFVKKAAAGKPILVYGFSRKKGKKDKPTGAAKSSAKVDATLFTFPGACEVPIASRHFDCFRVDLSALGKRKSPQVNESVAPVVFLLGGDRKLAAICNRGKLREKSLVAEMAKLLEPGSGDAIATRAAELRPALAELKKLGKKRQALEKALRKLRRGRKPPLKRIRAKEAELAAVDKQIDEVTKRLAH